MLCLPGSATLSVIGNSSAVILKDLFLFVVFIQVWPGCLLLCDFLMSQSLSESVLLELGAGVGLSSIVAAVQAKMVIASGKGTDYVG